MMVLTGQAIGFSNFGNGFANEFGAFGFLREDVKI